MKKLILGFVVCALMAAPALANITIINPAAPPSAPYTYTRYDFTTTVDHPGDGPFYIPCNVWNTNIPGIGTPTNAEVYLTPPLGEFNGWRDPGVLEGTTDVHIGFGIPNLDNPELFKLIQVEIKYLPIGGQLTNGSLYVQGNVSLPQPPVVTVGEDGWYDLTWTWKVWPQPNYETIVIDMLSSNGIYVDSVEVATVCIPAPAAVILGGIGTVLVGWLRRRRCL